MRGCSKNRQSPRAFLKERLPFRERASLIGRIKLSIARQLAPSLNVGVPNRIKCSIDRGVQRPDDADPHPSNRRAEAQGINVQNRRLEFSP